MRPIPQSLKIRNILILNICLLDKHIEYYYMHWGIGFVFNDSVEIKKFTYQLLLTDPNDIDENTY